MNHPAIFVLLLCITLPLPQAHSQLNVGEEPVAATKPSPANARAAKGPTEITAQEGAFDNEKYQAVFTGKVIVVDPEFNLTSEQLTVFLKKPKKKTPSTQPSPENEKTESGIDKAVAEGTVVLTQDKPDANGKTVRYVANAKKAIFDNATGTLTLSGWPKITKSVIGAAIGEKMVAIEEGCIITMTRDGMISYRNGRAKTTLQSTSIGKTETEQ